MKNYDVIVIGAGAVGLASALELSRKNLNVLVIEQFGLLNQLSSSSGRTRQFRLQYSEEYMTQLCLDTVPYWNDLESKSPEVLRSKVGSLWFGVDESESSEGEIKEAIKVMNKFGIPYAKLDKKDIENNFSFKNIPEEYIGFLQPDGGTINVPSTINLLKSLCDASGLVNFVFEEKVIDIELKKEIQVKTNINLYYSKKLVICAGPYTNRLLFNEGVQLQYEIWHMVSMYFKLTELAKNLPSWFVYESPTVADPGFYYGFENNVWDHPGYLRIAPAFSSEIIRDPIQRGSNPNINDIWLTANWVKKRLSFVDPNPEFTSTCLASIPLNPYKKMYLDFYKKHDVINKNVVMFSSGWAFKFVPLLGKICADLAIDGHSKYDISHFSIAETMQKKSFTTQAKRRLPF